MRLKILKEAEKGDIERKKEKERKKGRKKEIRKK